MIIVFNESDGSEVLASLPLPAICVLHRERLLFPQANIKIYFPTRGAAKSAFDSFVSRAREDDSNNLNDPFSFCKLQEKPE